MDLKKFDAKNLLGLAYLKRLDFFYKTKEGLYCTFQTFIEGMTKLNWTLLFCHHLVTLFTIFDRELCSKVLKEALLLFFLFLAWNQVPTRIKDLIPMVSKI